VATHRPGAFVPARPLASFAVLLISSVTFSHFSLFNGEWLKLIPAAVLTESPRGVKIRHKLVQNGGATNPP
jgi:hypothetical protein